MGVKNPGYRIHYFLGKAAHMTPIGRALYAAFKRADIATSSITGNPTFMTSVGLHLLAFTIDFAEAELQVCRIGGL